MTKEDLSITYENNIFYCTKNNTKWISVDGEKWYGEEKRIAELEKEHAELKEENKNLKTRLNAINLLTPELEKLSKDKDLKIKTLGERCNQLLKDKGNLTDKIADIKANCDLAIEGRDVKIMELERKLEQKEKDLADYQFNYPSIKELEKENNKLLDVINNQDVKIADLEKQIEQIEKVSDYNADQLTKAKEIIKALMHTPTECVQ